MDLKGDRYELSKSKKKFLKEFKKSIKDVNLAKAGKLKLKKADQLISEL